MAIEQDAYDAVAYPGYAYPATHPDRLAVMAMLHGLDPAPVERCRVLEIGCNEGANLIPMAYAIPGSEFVGFDVAALPIARGRARVAELGLKNIRLFQGDLMQVDWMDRDMLGVFDYIIAHGLYAWVPEMVRERLLAVCRERLSPRGIAFISYNALPGGHVRSIVRDIFLQRGGGGEGPAQEVARGLELLQFVAESRAEGDPFRGLMEKELTRLQNKDAQIVHHDELASEYHPVSFSTFIAHAGKHQLQYVSEATLPAPSDPCFQPQTAAKARALADGDAIAEEQILDFARMRSYRETLLCHAACAVDKGLGLEAFGRLRLASQAESSAGEGDGLRVFTISGGMRIESRDAGMIAAMEYLIEAWPRSVAFAELAVFLEAKGVVLHAEFLKLLLRLAVSRMIELHAWEAPVSRGIAERPRASAVSRQEAAAGRHPTTLLHGPLRLDDAVIRRFLLLLDGTRDRGELVQAMRMEYPEIDEAALAAGIEPALRMMHRAGVLAGEELG
jgi:SAM-dependent methyltransferase